MSRWRVRETSIEAVQVTAESARAVAEWCGGWAVDDLRWSENMECYRYPDDTDQVLGEHSLAGAMFPSWGHEPTPGAVMLPYGVPAPVGAWVALVDGSFTWMDDVTFQERYHQPAIADTPAVARALLALAGLRGEMRRSKRRPRWMAHWCNETDAALRELELDGLDPDTRTAAR